MSGHTPGPWSHHADIACKCGGIGSKDHPVATVTSGDWGDDYPSIRSVGGSISGQFEIYMEQITYGHVPQEEADANARLIASAPDLYHAASEILRTGLDEEAMHGDQREAIQLLRTALAKAQGVQS